MISGFLRQVLPNQALPAGKQVDIPKPHHFLDRKNAPSDLLVTLFPVKHSQRCVIFSKQISVVIQQQKPI
jgi:hypothetical protein